MKQIRIPTRFTVMGLALAVGLVGFSSDAAAQEPPAPPACTIQVEPAAVPVQTGAVRLVAQLSEAIGDAVSARLAAESGVRVTAVEVVKPDGEEQPARTVSIELNTAQGVAGEWDLMLVSEDGRRCAGKLQIRESGS